jgi:hypothetical protein
MCLKQYLKQTRLVATFLFFPHYDVILCIYNWTDNGKILSTGCIKKNWTDMNLLSISQNSYSYPVFDVYSFFGYL